MFRVGKNRDHKDFKSSLKNIMREFYWNEEKILTKRNVKPQTSIIGSG